MLNLSVVYGQKVLSISDVAENEGISVKFLEAIASSIKSKGLIKVRRGPKGGYMLNKAPSLISLHEIIDIFEPLQYAEQKQESARTNIDLAVRNQLLDLNKTVTVYLKGVTLKDMVEHFDAIAASEMYYI